MLLEDGSDAVFGRVDVGLDDILLGGGHGQDCMEWGEQRGSLCVWGGEREYGGVSESESESENVWWGEVMVYVWGLGGGE